MSKILDLIINLKIDFTRNWQDALDGAGIWDDVKALYQKKWPTEFCNRVLAFVVLAYDNDSGWIESHKDRWGNKERIATKLGLNIKEERVKDIIENSSEVVLDLVAWYIDTQTDWRWDAVLSHYEHASEMMRFAKQKTDDRIFVDEEEGGKKVFREVDIETLSKGNTAKGKNLMDAIEHRKQGDALLKEMQADFVQLDTVLAKEDRRKTTDKSSIENWEGYIAELRGKK